MTELPPVSIVIHALNEEKNIPFVLTSIQGRFDQIFVVDAGSTDRTKEICDGFNVEFVQIKGDRRTLVKQRNWALEKLPFQYDWVYILDADEQMTDELYSEICGVMADGGPPGDVDGYLVRYQEIILGRWVKRAAFYPNWGIRLIRHESVRHEDRSVNSHLKVAPERTRRLMSHFIHDDKHGFHAYIKRLSGVSTIEANTLGEIYTKGEGQIKGKLFTSNPLERRRWLKKVYNRLPFRPIIAFFYLYVFRMGFLEGMPGFYSAYLRMTHEVFVSALQYDNRQKGTQKDEQ